jgi:hypothetical protein
VATRADVQRLVTANRQISRLAARDVRRLWASLDTDDALQVREALEDVLPDLVTAYGELSATVAADWYDAMREQAGAAGRFSAVLAGTFAVDAVRANARHAIGPLFSATPEPDAALSLLELETDRMVLQPGRETATLSARKDPAKPRYARVPSNPSPCAFCTMLASQGAVYHSEAAAGPLGSDKYHAACGCQPVAIYDGQAYPEGYDPDAMYQQYADARQAAGSSNPKAILSSMRQLHGIH